MSKETDTKKKLLDMLMAKMDKYSADSKFKDQAHEQEARGEHVVEEQHLSDEHALHSGAYDSTPMDTDHLVDPMVDKSLQAPNPENTSGLDDKAKFLEHLSSRGVENDGAYSEPESMAEKEQSDESTRMKKRGVGSLKSQMKAMYK